MTKLKIFSPKRLKWVLAAAAVASIGSFFIFSETALASNPNAPTVTQQPTNQTITYGNNATFTAAATGNPTPAVQWKVSTDGGSSWSNISGATNTTLTVVQPTVSQTGYKYRAVFTNTHGTATTDDAALTVNKKSITASITAGNKTYDGTTTAVITNCTPNGIVGSDSVTCSVAGATFANRNVGVGKTITATGIALGGAASGNYQLSSTSAATTANISALGIAVTAVTDTKVYDGTISSAGVPTITSGTLATGDTASWTQTFDNKNAGTGKTLIPAGSVSDGNGGNNYEVTFVSNTTGQVSRRAIAVTAATDTKIYDGTTSSVGVPTITSGTLAVGDTAIWTQSFDSKDAGTGKTLTPNGTVSDGNGGNNYGVTFISDTTGVISARPVTITADTKAKNYGDPDPALTYQITNGSLAGGDSFSGALTRAAGEDIGTYAIGRGTLALNGNYELTYVGADLTIGTTAITVTANPQSKVYGDPDPELTYIFSPALHDGDTFSGSLERVAGENVGTYAITTGTLMASPNYNLSFTGDNLTIAARAVTFTADDKSKVYGDADPTLTYAIMNGSLVNGDSFTGALFRQPGEGCSGSRYEISQGTLALNGNYVLSFVPGVLTITNAALTVTADDQTINYGDPDPTFTVQYVGFVNGDTVSSLATAPTASVSGPHSNISTYSIVPTGGVACSYEFHYANGTLTVQNATLSTSTPSVVIGSNPPASSTISVPLDVNNATLDISALTASVGSTTVAILSDAITVNASTSVGDVVLQMPAGVEITAPSGWTGMVNLPQVQSNSSVTVAPDSGMTASVSSVIEIGFGDTPLTFDRAVRILFAGQGGNYVGYSQGGVFTQITTTCVGDTQTAGDALSAGGDCKITVGSDLVVWTKHFTSFVIYTQTQQQQSTGGGGGLGAGVMSSYSGGGTYGGVTLAVAPAPVPAVGGENLAVTPLATLSYGGAPPAAVEQAAPTAQPPAAPAATPAAGGGPALPPPPPAAPNGRLALLAKI